MGVITPEKPSTAPVAPNPDVIGDGLKKFAESLKKDPKFSQFNGFFEALNPDKAKKDLEWLNNPAISPHMRAAIAIDYICDMVPGLSGFLNDIKGLCGDIPFFQPIMSTFTNTMDINTAAKNLVKNAFPNEITGKPDDVVKSVMDALKKNGVTFPNADEEKKVAEAVKTLCVDGKILCVDDKSNLTSVGRKLQGIIGSHAQLPGAPAPILEAAKPRTEFTEEQKSSQKLPDVNPTKALALDSEHHGFELGSFKMGNDPKDPAQKLGLSADKTLQVYAVDASGQPNAPRAINLGQITDGLNSTRFSTSVVASQNGGKEGYLLSAPKAEAGEANPRQFYIVADAASNAAFGKAVTPAVEADINRFMKDGTVPQIAEAAPGMGMNMGVGMGMDPDLLKRMNPQQLMQMPPPGGMNA